VSRSSRCHRGQATRFGDAVKPASTWCADNGVVALQLTIATPEVEPLVVFGPAAARAVREVLADRGIRLFTGTPSAPSTGATPGWPRDVHVPADAVLALPRLVGNPLRGLPADSHGFIPVVDHCAVRSTPGVYQRHAA
jgi:sulfide:quinone oxidoreductase